MPRLTTLWITATVVLGTAVLAHPDTRVTILETTQNLESGRETAGRVLFWFAGDRAARIDSSGMMISRLDRGEMYLVNDSDRSYRVLPIRAGNEAEEAVPELSKSGEVREIGSWTAERYDMTFEVAPGETAQAVFWISTEVDVDGEAHRAFTEALADALGTSWLKASLSVEGYPVLQEMTVGVIKVTSEVRAIADEPAPPGTYDPPGDYRRIE